MKVAFMFPGQGAQVSGMGKDIYENFEEAKKVYDKASEILNIDMKKLCFEESQEELNKTENTQIAIAVTSLAILEVLKSKGIEAEVAVGLSLGEYVALMYAGYLSLEDGLKLLQKRGYYMGNFLPDEEFLMAAVLGMDSKLIEEVCKEVREKGMFVVPANYNCSTQTVISGNKDAIEEATNLLKEKGAKKVVPLNTSGPFHTEKLNKARDLYSKELENVEFNTENIKADVIKNIDGTIYNKQDDFKTILSNHIVSSVRFDKALKVMKEREIDTVIEIGPGKTMTSFVKKDLKEVNCFQTGTVEQLKETIEKFN